ncbi:zinc metalloprotease pitrilysin subfamily a, partial [Nannochloropsis oceanica]
VTILRHALPTNGILYADIGFDVSTQLVRAIGTHTGGLRSSSRISYKHPKGGVIDPTTDMTAHMFIRGKAVASKATELFSLIKDVLTDANLGNQKRVLEMLKESKARYRSSVVGAGNSFASIRLSSRYSLPGLISEKSEGISYMLALDALIEQAENDWPALQVLPPSLPPSLPPFLPPSLPPSLSLINNYLRNGYLWDNVRVMGGAYGGFCSFSRMSGLFSFGSYRDPNLLQTLDIYDAAAAHLAKSSITEEDLTQAIIGSIGDLDSPMAPDQKGFSSLIEHLMEESPEDRQQWRDEVLSTSSKDFAEFADRLADLKTRSTTAVVGSKKALEDANAKLAADAKLDTYSPEYPQEAPTIMSSPSLASAIRSAPPVTCASNPTMTVSNHTTRRTALPTTTATTLTTSSVIIPTRGQAELDKHNTGEGDDVNLKGKGDRRSEPRTLEEAGPLKVLYRKHDLLVIDKPPDVRMQGAFVVTVENLVRHYCPLDAPPSLALKYIHQLDYATSGVLCLGLSRKAAAATAELFMNRQTEKEYVALVEGHLDPSLLPVLDDVSESDDPALTSPSLPPSAYLPGIHPEAGGRGRGGKGRGRKEGSRGVIYKPASTYYRDKQLALERRKRKEEEEGGGQEDGWTEEERRVLGGMKWKEAKRTLKDISAECEALSAADKEAKLAGLEPLPPPSLPPSK